MLAVELYRPADPSTEQPRSRTSAIVIDLFRATSTLQVLADGGHSPIELISTPQQAEAALSRGRRCVGEWLAVTPPGFSCGNSPTQARLLDPAGPPVTFLSTNGSKAFVAADRVARRVLAANLFNIGVVRQALLDLGGQWLLVPAGVRGEPCIEDDYVCSLLAGSLTGRAKLGARIRQLINELADVTVEDLRSCVAARRLVRTEPTGRSDVELILAGRPRSGRIPVYASGAVTDGSRGEWRR